MQHLRVSKCIANIFIMSFLGLDKEWNWISFPLLLDELRTDIKHDNKFTFSWYEKSLFSDKICRSAPIAVTTDNENKMLATFDGRNELNAPVYRYGCVEHALSTCIDHVFEGTKSEARKVDDKLSHFIKQLAVLENYYNRRFSKERLPVAIPEKSATRAWRSWYSRLCATVANYATYQSVENEVVVNNLPSLLIVKSLLEVMKDTKDFFDIFEKDEPTSHLSFLSYLILNIKLF